MKEISCDIIQDLLPLYADEMLSDDSIHLVEEHLKECELCKSQLEQLRQEGLDGLQKPAVQDDGTKKAFKKIRRSILIKRFVSIFMTIVLVLAAVRVGYYFYAEKRTYLSWEESGLKMDGDKLCATKSYLGKFHTIFSADQHTMFIIMFDTMQARHDYPEQNPNSKTLVDFSNQIDPADIDPEKEFEYENRLSGIETVYYLPEEYVNFHFDFEHADVWDKQSKEAISKSKLLWSSSKVDSSLKESESSQEKESEENKSTLPPHRTVKKVYNGKTKLRSLDGKSWTPPKGSRLLNTGEIVDEEGTAIGYDASHPLSPNAVG